jgi:hypothetical protein
MPHFKGWPHLRMCWLNGWRGMLLFQRDIAHRLALTCLRHPTSSPPCLLPGLFLACCAMRAAVLLLFCSFEAPLNIYIHTEESEVDNNPEAQQLKAHRCQAHHRRKCLTFCQSQNSLLLIHTCLLRPYTPLSSLTTTATTYLVVMRRG